MERQLRGEGFAPLPVDTSRPHPAQKRLLAANTVAAGDPQREYSRRSNAIRAVMDYCLVEEGRTRCHTAAVESPRRRPEDTVSTAAVSVFLSHEKERPGLASLDCTTVGEVGQSPWMCKLSFSILTNSAPYLPSVADH